MGAVARGRKAARGRLVGFLTRHLTKPLRSYEQRVPNNLSSLKQHLRVGDVVLVEGDQRISQVIRYLTQSSWSHSALYIGDELRHFAPSLMDSLLAQHGEEARHLVIEAEAADGVICSPVGKYVRHNMRVCRPRGLRREDLDRVIDELIGQLGHRYNVRHVFDLGRYFFPVSLIPGRFRGAALRYGGDTTRRVICSTMLARAFARVGYPILPHVTLDDVARQHTWVGRMLGRNGHSVRARYRREDPTYVTPRDFDLSPYFDIVKFNHLASGKFDYRRIEWVQDEQTEPTIEPTPTQIAAVGTRQSKASAA